MLVSEVFFDSLAYSVSDHPDQISTSNDPINLNWSAQAIPEAHIYFILISIIYRQKHQRDIFHYAQLGIASLRYGQFFQIFKFVPLSSANYT